jgi:hypothetical protein
MARLGLVSALVVLLAAPSACHLCEYREQPGTDALRVNRGESCPVAPDTRRFADGSSILSVGANRAQHDVAGTQACCYQAQVFRGALDAEVRVDYIQFGEGGCMTAADLLAHPPAEVEWDLPAASAMAGVVSGPTVENGKCTYVVHVTRAELRAIESRCVWVTFEAAAYDVARCAAAADVLPSLQTPASDEKAVRAIDSGPTVDEGRSSLPATECEYDVVRKTSSDVCG